MKRWKKALVSLLAGCLVCGMMPVGADAAAPQPAGQTGYEYTITLSAGNKGQVKDGREKIVVSGLNYGNNTRVIFSNDYLEDNIEAVFQEVGRRFGFGGEAPQDQRVYFVNIKEITGNKYGTPGPVPFRVVDANIGLDMDISVKCFGEYSYRITNPVLFYTNVCGNVEDCFTREELDSQLKSEVMTALQPAFARISEQGIRYSALPGHTAELSQALNEALSEKWENLRGIRMVSFGVSSIKASSEDEAMLKELQKNAVFRNPAMAAAQIAGAQAAAMQAAASNQNAGAAMAFAGMNMAAGAGGMNLQNLYAMGQNGAAQPAGKESWTCACGTVNTGKFCSECGKPRP